MLRLIRRHTKSCSHHRPVSDIDFTRCQCVIHCHGRIGGELVRVSLHTRDWGEASRIVVDASARGFWRNPSPAQGKGLTEAIDAFLADAESPNGRALRPATLSKYQTLLRRLNDFAAARKLRGLAEISSEHIRDLRDTWSTATRGTGNYLSSLGTFFEWCRQNEWLDRNPVLTVNAPHAPRGEDLKKRPFTEGEVNNIVAAAGKGSDLQTFVLLLRYSGLRISDAAVLQKGSIGEDSLNLTTIKNQIYIELPIPPWLTTRLRLVAAGQTGEYLFAHGSTRLGTLTGYWRRRIHAIIKRLGITKKTAHSFRHTYASELLASGVSIETVSKLLTHSSVVITERSYASVIPRGEDRVRNALQKLWAGDAPR